MYQSLQGNIGLGKAIEYFTSHQIPVAIPLNDTQKYDLIADFNGGLQRISVKTSRYTRKDKRYDVLLKNSGGASGNNKIRIFDNSSCDYLFAYIGDNRCYLIPSNKIDVKHSIMLGGEKYSEYEVKSNPLSLY